MKVIVVFGTRPEAIKLAPVVRELKHVKAINVLTCSTGQHREMLSQALAAFDIVPDIRLDVMSPGQSLNQLSARLLSSFDNVLERERPYWVLVQGDTTTAFSAALASFHRKIQVGHVEAGLRSRDRTQPFPEEVNRCLTAVLADLHFAPTRQARLNLLAEGVPPAKIVVTGNTIIDALRSVLRAPAPSDESFVFSKALRARGAGSRLVLVTAHRRENLGRPLVEICSAVRELALRYSESAHFVYPMHLNPNVTSVAIRKLQDLPNVTLSGPLDS